MAKRVFFLFLAIIGIGILFWGYNSYKKSQEAKEWPTAQGKVISSEVDSHWSSHRTGATKTRQMMHSAKVLYEYTVEDNKYTSNKISFGDTSSSVRSDASKVVKKYRPKKEILVYYDPKNPKTAVLEPGKAGGLLVPFIAGSMFLFVGILGVVSRQ